VANPPDSLNTAATDGPWSRGGAPVEELPDPFAPEPRADEQPFEAEPEKRRRRWPVYLYSAAGLLFLTLVWLVLTAPLSRALEPLDDPALLLLSDDGHAIARRGAVSSIR
jgi:penicillin-binding protein 1A